MRRVWAAWDRWAFAPVDTAPMAALRIAVGLLTIGWALSFLPDADAFLSDDGLTPGLPRVEDGWVFRLDNPVLTLLVLAAAGVALTVGWHTRLAAIAVTVGLVLVQRRAPLTLNSGDVLLRNVALFVALMPAGEVWSLDARRRKRAPVPRAPWALRMLQVQVSILYAAAVMAKLRGDAWNEGTAVGIALQLGDLQRFAVPDAFTHSLLWSTSMTYGTLVLETLLVFGLWFRRLRVPVALAGIGMHLGIDATLAVGWFSYALVAAYLAFVPPEALRAFVARWLPRRRTPSSAPPPEPVSLVKQPALGSQG